MESMATARTLLSPRCCWTSATKKMAAGGRLLPDLEGGVDAGSSSLNSTSSTGPMISTILPLFMCSDIPPSSNGNEWISAPIELAAPTPGRSLRQRLPGSPG